MGFSLIMGMVFYLKVGLPLLFLVYFTTPIMQYRRFYFIHSSSLFLGGFWNEKIINLSLSCLITLAACGKNEAAKLTSSTNNHQSKVQGQVTLILKTEKESKKKSVEIQKGDTVLDVLEAVYPVQENDGFITEIDGISQDKDKGIYWMFDVNGKLGEKAANQLKVEDGDEIKFYQEKYN